MDWLVVILCMIIGFLVLLVLSLLVLFGGSPRSPTETFGTILPINREQPPQFTFVNRDDEVAALRQCLEENSGRLGGVGPHSKAFVVAIAAQALGTGKTTLGSEFARRNNLSYVYVTMEGQELEGNDTSLLRFRNWITRLFLGACIYQHAPQSNRMAAKAKWERHPIVPLRAIQEEFLPSVSRGALMLHIDEADLLCSRTLKGARDSRPLLYVLCDFLTEQLGKEAPAVLYISGRCLLLGQVGKGKNRPLLKDMQSQPPARFLKLTPSEWRAKQVVLRAFKPAHVKEVLHARLGVEVSDNLAERVWLATGGIARLIEYAAMHLKGNLNRTLGGPNGLLTSVARKDRIAEPDVFLRIAEWAVFSLPVRLDAEVNWQSEGLAPIDNDAWTFRRLVDFYGFHYTPHEVCPDLVRLVVPTVLVTAALVDSSNTPNPALWGKRLLDGDEACLATDGLLTLLARRGNAMREARETMLAALLLRFSVLVSRPCSVGSLAAIFRTEFLDAAPVPEPFGMLRHFPFIVSGNPKDITKEEAAVAFDLTNRISIKDPDTGVHVARSRWDRYFRTATPLSGVFLARRLSSTADVLWFGAATELRMSVVHPSSKDLTVRKFFTEIMWCVKGEGEAVDSDLVMEEIVKVPPPSAQPPAGVPLRATSVVIMGGREPVPLGTPKTVKRRSLRAVEPLQPGETLEDDVIVAYRLGPGDAVLVSTRIDRRDLVRPAQAKANANLDLIRAQQAQACVPEGMEVILPTCAGKRELLTPDLFSVYWATA